MTDNILPEKQLSAMDLQNFLYEFERKNRSSWSLEMRFLAAQAGRWHSIVQQSSVFSGMQPSALRVQIFEFRQKEIADEVAAKQKEIAELESEAAKLFDKQAAAPMS